MNHFFRLLVGATMVAMCALPAHAASFKQAKKHYAAADYSAAIAELQPLAKAGNADANNLLGEMYLQGVGVNSDITLAKTFFEAGARVGMVAVDQTTIDYVEGRPFSPKGEHWELAVAAWQDLHSDDDAEFDHVVVLDGASIAPQVTWGTSPEMVLPVFAQVPNPAKEKDDVKAAGITRALEYMGLTAEQAITDIQLDRVFIGSCTNSRIEDMRAAAAVAKGRSVASTVKQVLVVPGSQMVKAQAEAEGLHEIFIAAGMDWREPGCSMCLAMNADKLGAGEHCASTSNRNFEGRQGNGGRTHLMSPAMAAAAAITGYLSDVRKLAD